MSRNEKTKFWRCERKVDKCKGRVNTSLDNAIICLVGNHDHGPDPALVISSRIKTNLKRLAIETMEAPAQLINHALITIGVSSHRIAQQGHPSEDDTTQA
jgi:hypothetical protein